MKITKQESKSGVDIGRLNKINYKSKLIESLCAKLSKITPFIGPFIPGWVAAPEGSIR